ncbi:MAG: menaquinone biosynthetic enzyme MqnA/MqnD family protein [Candidatus Anammoxibacter sp.]
MTDKLKVGAVSYMNTKPLVWGLEKMSDTVELYFDVPSRLSQMFDSGLLDVALLPVVRYFGNDKYRVISGVSIATKGAVESVNLFLKKDINSINEVALDTSSQTSRALTAIVLRELYGLNPNFVDWKSGPDIDSSDADAVLLIGDDAMKIKSDKYRVLDLGDEWFKLTQLPFVFALWVTKCDTKLDGFDKTLQKVKENGLNAIDEIAAIEAARLNFSKETCLKYLSKSILYDLGDSEIKGLTRFYDFASRMGLIGRNNHGAAVGGSEQEKMCPVKFYSDSDT